MTTLSRPTTDTPDGTALAHQSFSLAGPVTLNEAQPFTPTPYFAEYATYNDRLRSFDNGWPSACPMNPGDLADAGLYYTGTGDKVQCAYCRGKLYNWGPSDVAMVEHSKHFPKCSFVLESRKQQRNFGHRTNASYASNSFTISIPAVYILKAEGYSELEIRKGITKMRNSLGMQLADIQAEVLRDVLNTLRQSGDAVDGSIASPPQSQVISPAQNQVPPSQHELIQPSQTQITPSPLPNPAEQPAITTSTSNNQPQVDGMVARGKSSVANGASSNQSIFLSDQVDFESGRLDPGFSGVADGMSSQLKNRNSKQKSDSAPVQSNSRRAVLQDKLKRLQEENAELKRLQTCRGCGEMDANTLYLPCRHLVCCHVCADDAQTCVFCSQTVLGSVRTYRA